MKKPFLPYDDLPPAKRTRLDGMLRRQLEESISKRLYEACAERPVMQELLSSCEWYITTNASALTLVIACPDLETNWKVLNNIVSLGSLLEPIVSSAKIRVCPPVGMGTPFEIRVDEISVYQDAL